MKLRLTITLFTLLSIIPLVWSQVSMVEMKDALNSMNSAPNNLAKIDSIAVWNFKLFMNGRTKEAGELVSIGINIAEKDRLLDKLTILYIEQGRVLEREGKIKNAIEAYNKASQYLSYNDKLAGKLYLHTGRSFQLLKEVDSMVLYYTKAIDWFEINEPYRKWIIYEAWHNTYVDHSDFDKAMEYLMKAYDITKPKGKRMDHGLILYRLRAIYDRVGDMTNYAKYTKEYHDLVVSSGGSPNMIHGYEQDSTLTSKEKVEKFKTLASEYKNIGYEDAYLNTITKLGDLYYDINDLSKAKASFLTVLKYKSKTIDKVVEDIYGKLHEINSKLGNYKEAYQYAILEKTMKDSLLNEDKRNLLFSLEKKYETEKKEQQVALLTAENDVKDLRIKEGNYQRNIFFSITLGLLGLLSILYYSFRKNKESKRLLEVQNKIIEKNLAEKDVLLREIHHRVKNNLQVVSSLLSLQSNYISDDAALKAINEGKDRVSSMALIHQNLYKENDITGIETTFYFTELIDHLFDSYNIRENEISLVKNIESIKLDVDTMIPLGLIANELISNALKHGFTQSLTGTLTFTLKMRDDQLIMSVKDTGKGINEEEFLNSKSFGNKMITAFMQKLGAKMIISNDQGAHIELVINKFKLAA